MNNPFNFPKPHNKTPFPFELFNVPCNGCRLCCQNHDMLRILPEDDPDQYQTAPHPYLKDALMLDHKPNGDCIYLGETGCTIYETRPLMCREMDCRAIAHGYTWTQVRKFGHKRLVRNFLKVWERGKQLIREQNKND